MSHTHCYCKCTVQKKQIYNNASESCYAAIAIELRGEPKNKIYETTEKYFAKSKSHSCIYHMWQQSHCGAYLSFKAGNSKGGEKASKQLKN